MLEATGKVEEDTKCCSSYWEINMMSFVLEFLLNFKFLCSVAISPKLGHSHGPLPTTSWLPLVLKFVSGQESLQPTVYKRL